MVSQVSKSTIFDKIAQFIIPGGDEWGGYAQAFVSAILKHAWNNKLNSGDINRLVNTAGADELREIFAGTPAAHLNADARVFSAVRAIVCQRFAAAPNA